MSPSRISRRPLLLTLAFSLAVATLLAIVNRYVLVSPSTAAAGPTSGVGRTQGRLDAPAQLDLWSDFQCPSCRLFEARIEPNIVQHYVESGRVRLTFHDMAFLGQESVDAAIAARCADRQGKFWQYKHLLFANQGGRQSGAFAWSRLAEFASSLHVDIQQFTACANDRSILDAVSSETAQAYARHVKETPTLMVNGVTVMAVNDWPSVSAAIEAVLAPDAASRR